MKSSHYCIHLSFLVCPHKIQARWAPFWPFFNIQIGIENLNFKNSKLCPRVCFSLSPVICGIMHDGCHCGCPTTKSTPTSRDVSKKLQIASRVARHTSSKNRYLNGYWKQKQKPDLKPNQHLYLYRRQWEISRMAVLYSSYSPLHPFHIPGKGIDDDNKEKFWVYAFAIVVRLFLGLLLLG